MSRPSYQNGFASPHGLPPLYPGLWEGLQDAWLPCLGPAQRNAIPNIVRPQYFAGGISGQTRDYLVRDGLYGLDRDSDTHLFQASDHPTWTSPYAVRSQVTVFMSVHLSSWANNQNLLRYWPTTGPDVDEWVIKNFTSAGNFQILIRSDADAITVNEQMSFGASALGRFNFAFAFDFGSECRTIGRHVQSGTIVRDTDSGIAALNSGFSRWQGPTNLSGAALHAMVFWDRALSWTELELLVHDECAVARVDSQPVKVKSTGGATPVVVGIATEIDSALPVIAPVAVGLATEIDSALPVLDASPVAVGLATEIDSALPVSAGGPVVVGIATEIDSALPVLANSPVVVGIATEIDSALSVTVGAVGLSVGIATEIDSALPVAIGPIAVGLAIEIDSALAVISGEPAQATDYLVASKGDETTLYLRGEQ